MDVRPLVFFCLCLLTVIYATKEDASYGSSKSDALHLIQLIKRIGKDNGVDLDDFIRDEETREQCKANKVTRNSIIKSTDSIASGAKYVSSHKKIPSLAECSDMCCDDSDCDTAIYQENKDQHCYLFACQGLCEFTEHIDYSVTVIERPKPTPPQQQHEEEAQLENLHGNNGGAALLEETANHQDDDHAPDQEEEVSVTEAPTPAPKPYVAPHTAGLGGFCTSDVSCEDPNAGCFDEKCGCRQGYYNKAGLCRKVCPESHFECLKLGSLTRGPECVPKLQVCDSYMQCADGSDEFNCEDSAGNAPDSSWNQQYESPSSSWPDRSDQTNYNNNINNDQSVRGRQSVQTNHDHLAETPQADHKPDFSSQSFKATDTQRENVQPQNVVPSVRTKTVPTQHAISSIGNGNYMGQNVQQPQPYDNPNTNNNPPHYVKSPENKVMPSANANPIVNSNPDIDYKENAPQRQSPQSKPQISQGPGEMPKHLPDKESSNRLSNQYQDPSIENHFSQQLDQRNNIPLQPGASNRTYSEGGPPEGIPVNRPVSQSQRVKSVSTQKQPWYQQSPSRTVNRTGISPPSIQKTGLKVKQPKESHYLSKPSASSSLSASSSSSSSSHSKPQSEPQRSNLHQNLQPSSSADKISTSSHVQSGFKPSGYKSSDSQSSSLSSHSNPQSDSSNWSDNDVYLPYGSGTQKLSPSGRQPSQSQYYGQSSQYYRPYSSDSLNSLPSSLLGNAGSQEDFSQFGGPYLEPQKPAGRLQYQLNNGNPGYMNYPEPAYNSQFSSPNRYNNFGGDFSSTNYQDPDFYLSLGNPPVYHPDGLYDDNQPGEISHPDTITKNKDESQGGRPQGPAHLVPMKSRPPAKEEPVPSKTRPPAPVAQSSISTLPPVASNKTSGASHSAKVNHTDQATSKPSHHSVGAKEQVFLSREKVIIASSSSEAEGPLIALSLGLAFTIILIGLLACRLRNMKHRLRKGRPLNSNEADYLINGMYL